MSDQQAAISLVIADDHPIVRAGLKQILEIDPGMRVVGEADDGEKAYTLILEKKPAVAIMDVQMPRMTGIEVAARLQRERISVHVILLTMVKDQNTFFGALDLGVEGYVLKDTVVDDIAKAVRAVYDNQFFVSPELSNLLLRKRKVRTGGETNKDLEILTPAERRVLSMVAELKTNQEIADTLFIAKRTVENHKVNIAKKLDLSGANATLKFALRHKEEL